MHLLADGMAGAVTEILAVTGLLDDVPGGLVHLPTLKWPMILEGVAYTGNGGVTGRGHDTKDLLVNGRHFLANKAGPGEIAVNGTGLVQFAPEIDENEVSRSNRSVRSGTRLVMRVAAVRADSADGRVVGHEA